MTPIANDVIIEAAARAAHEVNRTYCKAIGDDSQVNWEDAPEWQRRSAVVGARGVLVDGNGPEDSHASWLKEKELDGWKYGPVKDATKKEHPCFVPYEELPDAQKMKDTIFVTVVSTVGAALGWPVPAATSVRLKKLEDKIDALQGEVESRKRGKRLADKENDAIEEELKVRIIELEGTLSQVDHYFESVMVPEGSKEIVKRAVKTALDKRQKIAPTAMMRSFTRQLVLSENLKAMTNKQLATALQDRVWANKSMLSDESAILEETIDRLEYLPDIEDNPAATTDVLSLVAPANVVLDQKTVEDWTPEQRIEAEKWAGVQVALANDHNIPVDEIPAMPAHVRQLFEASPKA